MSGTTPTDKSALSSLEICSILESCAKCNVSLLKFGDLHVEFGRQANPSEPAPSEPTSHIIKNSDKEISDTKHAELTKEALEVEELRTKEEILAELIITNPLKAEEMIRNQELEDDTDESDDNE